MGRPGNLVDGRLRSGIPTALRQAQRVFVIGTVKITGTLLKNEQYRTMQARHRDLQQQSDRREKLTETAQITRPLGQRTAISTPIAHNLIRSTDPG
jgi:hypothetical protein